MVRTYRQFGLLAGKNETEMRIDLTNGAHVFCAGLDSPERIEGNHYCGIAVDEMSDTKPHAITTSILPALNAYNGWLMIMGIPKRTGVGGLYYRDLIEKIEGEKEAFEGLGRADYFHWTAPEIYNDQQINGFRAMMDDRTFREQYMATWESAGGLVYYAFNRKIHVRSDVYYNPKEKLIIASDFNVSPMSWCVLQDTDGKIRVIDELSISDTNTQATLDELYRRWGTHSAGFEFYGDAAGKQRHTSASETDYTIILNDKRFGKPNGRARVLYPSKNPMVHDRVTSVNTKIQNALGEVSLTVSNKCKELIKDFEGISYKSGTSDIDKSNPDRTHMSDALGYYIHFRYPLRVQTNANVEFKTRGWS